MDENTQWLHATLEALLPGFSITIWRGVTPLMGWWLAICARGTSEWQVTLRHETIERRDRTGVASAVSKKTPVQS